MRSRRDDVPEGAAVERALRSDLVGLGGALSYAPLNIADALITLRREHDERLAARVERFATAAEGSLVWTRDGDGFYWLGCVRGRWVYDDSSGAAAIDLVHVRPCQWVGAPIPDQAVPAGVLATFSRGGKNWQGIHAAGVFSESMRLWERGR